MTHIMTCPEECDASMRVHDCAEVLKAPTPNGSCWRCDGVGFVEHDGDPFTPRWTLKGEVA